MANNRIFYAVQAVGIGQSPTPTGSIVSEGSGFRWIKGVQEVGYSTDYGQDPVMELGQLEPYQLVENMADIEFSITKVIDGRHSLYLQSVGHDGTGNIVSASNKRTDLYLAIYPDSSTAVSGTSPDALIYASGMYVGSVNYTFPVEGNATEAITLQGNDKIVYGPTQYGNMNLNTGFATIAQTPHSPNVNVARRQHFQAQASTLPTSVSRAIRGGYGNIQNINVSLDFSRENLFELGSFRPYFKKPGYPIPVTSDFEVISISGDLLSASGDAANLSNESIKLISDVNGPNGGAGQFQIDLGTRNKLTNVSVNGGGTDGSNASVTYSYQNYNKMLITDSYAGNGSGDGVSGQYWA